MAIQALSPAQLEQMLLPHFVSASETVGLEWVTVTDDSAAHHGHAGSAHGGHFQVEICSRRFETLSRMARHRLVYDQVQPWMQNGIHALQIRALTPAEYTTLFDNPHQAQG